MKQKSVSFDVTLRQELCKHQAYFYLFIFGKETNHDY
jgi:hypothetical protein